jgi:GT2 family glycosyltransferase
VVDNGSDDGTAAAVRARFPDVQLVVVPANLGAAGRTLGVRALETPYVAFSDDDSWWRAGSLDRAAALLDANPQLGLLAARILVGPEGRPDPTLADMEHSPLARDGLPGPPVLGFIACGSVVRRSAYLEAGGFEPRFRVGAEELLLALDLRALGWRLAYVDDVVAYHHPSCDTRHGRTRTELRNGLWTAWLRFPLPQALRHTALLFAAGGEDRVPALAAALRELPWAVRRRRVLPRQVERERRAVYG